MTAIFNQNIRSFTSDAFINAISDQQPNAWVTGQVYSVGEIVEYSNRKYVASSAGTSGATPPTHTSGVASDGGVTWIFLEVLPIGEAYKGNLYAFIGRPNEWEYELAPDAPELNDLYEYGIYSNMISLKKISTSDLRLGVARYDWTSGTVYDQYDSTKDVLSGYAAPFYVLTDENNLYKCINNNNGAESTSKPTGTGIALINTADGYSWKYLASVSSSDSSEFLTTDFVPVEYKTYDDISFQWDVQQNAKEKSISTFEVTEQTGTFTAPVVNIITTSNGVLATATATKTLANEINQILIDNCGSGYERDGTFAYVTETGAAGSGATATATIVDEEITEITVDTVGSGYTGGAIVLVTGDGDGVIASAVMAVDDSVQSITVTNGGSGWSTATVHILPGAAGAVGIPIMAPLRGHGFNAISELKAVAAIVNVRLATSTHLLTGPDSDFRQVGIVTDLLDDSSEFAFETYYIGPAHPDFDDGGSPLNKMKENSGNLLYVSNIQAAVRSISQEERIKIAIVF